MKVFTKVLKHILFVTTIIITGLCLFTFILSLNINNTLMTSKYHETLLAKNGVYTYVNELISTSLDGIINDLNIEQASDQNAEFLNILKKTTSPEMINMNINSITEQIFQYFRGERKKLPDLYIDINPPINNKDSSENVADKAVASDISEQIKKINLQALLLTFNRTDISEQLTLVKFAYFVVSHITGLSILLVALMILLIIFLYRKSDTIIKWFISALFICGIFNLALSIALFIYLNKVLPNNIYLLTMTLPFNSELIKSYINDLLFPLSFFCFILGIVFPIIGILLYTFRTKFVKILRVIKVLASKLPIKSKKLLKYGVMTFVLVSIVFGMGFNLYAFKSGYESNSFSNVVSKLTNTNTVTQVISAKDDTIYTLQVKLIDGTTDMPVQGIKISVAGQSKSPEKYYNTSGITDEDGCSRFILGQGTFHLSFTSPTHTSEYNLPSPFFYEIKSAGITILTINTEKSKPADGVAEIEVLNDENLPITNLELYLAEEIDLSTEQESELDNDSLVSPNPKTSKYFSVTNNDGIAVFKLPPGKYYTGFTNSKFPVDYVLPEMFEINISSDYVTRYTIRISNNEDSETSLSEE
jgi:uncharacterized membrane protein